MKRKIFMVAAVIFSSRLQAQTSSNNLVADSAKNLDEVVITATKTPIKQSQTGKIVSVIDQGMLQQNVGKNLTEILNLQAGLFIIGANNSPGTNQDVYFRGAGTGNVLVLIDGVPVSDASFINNAFDLNSISPSQVERVEILKGAQSTLWGSDAVAGVINVITKKSGSKKIGVNAGASYGSYQTFKGNAGLNGKVNGLSYNLTYNHNSSQGFSSAFDSTNTAPFDKDGMVQHTVQANMGYQFNSKFSASLLSNYGNYRTDLDGGAFTDDLDYTAQNINWVNSIKLHYDLGKGNIHFSNTLISSNRSSLNDTSNAISNGNLYGALYKSQTLVSELYGNYNLTKQFSFVAGLQRMAQNTDQQDSGYIRDFAFGYASKLGKDSAKANNLSVYASALLVNAGGFNAEAGFRYNRHNIYGSNTTFSLNPSFNIDANTRVFVNISSAYKIPSLYQLYSEYGNRSLQPEKTINYELGVQTFGNDKKNSFRIVGFKRAISNLIIFYTNPSTYISQYINRDKQDDYGFEMESRLSIGSIGNWINNFTYIDGQGTNDNVKVNNLYRRPNFSFNSTLTVQPVKALTISSTFRFVSSRLKGLFDAGPAEMPKYYTIDFYGAYQMAKQVNVFIDLRNLTNQQYFDVVGYNSRRFNFTAGIMANF